LNTRIIKFEKNSYGVLIASSNLSQSVHFYQDKKITIIKGDFSAFMNRVVQNLEKCVKYAENQNQKKMI